LLLLLEALTRGVLPHHALCTVHDIGTACIVGPSLSSEGGGGSSNGSSNNGSSEHISDAGQNLRNVLDAFVGSRNNSVLVQLCCSILQDGIRASAQQRQQQPQQPQQQPQQPTQQQEHQPQQPQHQ
jgi:hypothetical protein